MTEQMPERGAPSPDGRDESPEFTAESGDQERFVDDSGETQVTKVAGEDEFTTDDQPAVSPDELERATPLPGGLVQ